MLLEVTIPFLPEMLHTMIQRCCNIVWKAKHTPEGKIATDSFKFGIFLYSFEHFLITGLIKYSSFDFEQSNELFFLRNH